MRSLLKFDGPVIVTFAVLCMTAARPHPVQAAELWVFPGGGGNYPSIQAAIDAAQPGDHVVLADGTFRGQGNWDLYFRGKPITVRSGSGHAGSSTIDLTDLAYGHRGFIFCQFENEQSVVRDLTIRNADVLTSG